MEIASAQGQKSADAVEIERDDVEALDGGMNEKFEVTRDI